MTRLLDIIFAASALLVFLPIGLIIVAVLRCTGEGEIFYIQKRIGRGGRSFGLFKFATMLKNSPSMGTGTVTIMNDPRVLPVGALLRKTKVNELPQLINILRGDMSLVGPRPMTEQTFSYYSKDHQHLIASVRPGLSGIGSVLFRDEERLMHARSQPLTFYRRVIAPFKGEVELWFVNHRSLRNYVTCILVTIWVVLRPSSKIIWRVFNDLPEPPDELKSLKY